MANWLQTVSLQQRLLWYDIVYCSVATRRGGRTCAMLGPSGHPASKHPSCVAAIPCRRLPATTYTAVDRHITRPKIVPPKHSAGLASGHGTPNDRSNVTTLQGHCSPHPHSSTIGWVVQRRNVWTRAREIFMRFFLAQVIPRVDNTTTMTDYFILCGYG